MNVASTQATAVPLDATAQAAVTRHHKLSDAALQFEGMLLQELLKPMKDHGFFAEDDQNSTGDSSGFADTLSSFGTECMATAIAKGGGLGIAKSVVKQVESESSIRDQPASRTLPEELHNKIANGTKVHLH